MINAAIVGTGSISNLHIQGLLEFPERCRIVALCDIYPEKAEAMGLDTHGLDVTYDELALELVAMLDVEKT